MDDIDKQIDGYIAQGIQWIKQPFSEEKNLHDAKGYIGIITKARFVLASFDIEKQGFPAGSRGYDGTYTNEGLIIRLTQEQAQRLFEDAKKKTKKT